MIARSFTLPALMVTLDNWPLTLFSVVSVVLCSFVLGWIMTVREALPGNTAIWGAWPGAAFAMCVMAEDYGADTRLVAVMQYVRVILVVILASVVSHFFVAPQGDKPGLLATLFHTGPALAVLITIAAILVCAFLGRISRIPAGSMLLPMGVATVLQNSGVFQPELPTWLLLSSYAILGWTIGLRFTKPIILYALHALPAMLVSILTLILLCCGIAVLMVVIAGVDPLTAYLAASPGGADSIAIIAASSQVDLPFVMSVQMARFAVILFLGPLGARFASAKMEQRRARLQAKKESAQN
jgi:membrane AbrB-like protein